MTTASPWWAPHRHADRRPRLLQRNAIAAAIRDWFAQRDFVEVETAALQVSPGNETHLSAFATEAILPDASRTPLYLHTSPEFACKKLLAAGEPRIFSLGPVYRNRERGPLHHPEFTMLEWYRASETYGSLMDDCAALLALAAERAGDKNLRLPQPRGRPLRRAGAADRRRRLFSHAGIDLLATVGRRRFHRPRRSPCRRQHRRPAHRARRHLDRSFQPRHGRAHRAVPRHWPRHDPLRIPDLGSRPRPSEPARYQSCRAFRALLLRRRTRQRLRRADRRGRAAPPLRRRHGRKAENLRRALPDRRGFFGRPRASCPRLQALPSASTASSCWRPAPGPSRTSSGRLLQISGRRFHRLGDAGSLDFNCQVW